MLVEDWWLVPQVAFDPYLEIPCRAEEAPRFDITILIMSRALTFDLGYISFDIQCQDHNILGQVKPYWRP